MAATDLPHAFPTELSQAVSQDAELDAARVGEFLQCFHTELAKRLPTAPRWTEELLLGLAVGLRFLSWERNGVFAHQDAGFPSGHEVLRRVIESLAKPAYSRLKAPWRFLMTGIVALFAENFAWSGRREVDADITLTVADEDVLANAIADFLWDHRQLLCDRQLTCEEECHDEA